MDNKKKLLIVLLFVLAALVVYRLMNPFRQDRVAQLTHTGKGAGEDRVASTQSSPAAGQLKDPDFLLALLQHPPQHSGRVLTPGFWEPGGGLPGGESPPETEPDPDAAAASAVTPLDPALQVKQELGQFRIFGFFKSRGELALFMERGKEILVVRKGDRIDGVYRVEEITPQVLTIRAENIDEAIHIDLGEL
ncbi:MAG: hypothetical protein WAK57_16030 [Desulfobacterales bacterium]